MGAIKLNIYHLLIFTRYPEANKAKTRLIPELGATGAANLQKKLTEKVVAEGKKLISRTSVSLAIHFSGGDEAKMRTWLGPLHYVRQKDGDLGRKMQNGFRHSFANGTHAAILIGSDIPEIEDSLLDQAFIALQAGKVVIGPSEDGGYYLIGLADSQAEQLLHLLFENIPWSTNDVFIRTMARLDKAKVETYLLPTLRDIDTPDDLPYAREQGLL